MIRLASSDLDIAPEEYKENHKYSHTTIFVSKNNNSNKIINTTAHELCLSEQISPHHMRTKLAQPKTKKLPLLRSYLPHKVNFMVSR